VKADHVSHENPAMAILLLSLEHPSMASGGVVVTSYSLCRS